MVITDAWMVIVNPKAGSGRGLKDWPIISNQMYSHGLHFTCLFTEHKYHAMELTVKAINDGYRNIVAVGGDGTFSEVLNGADVKVPMGFIPSGSGNDFIRTTGEKPLEQRLDEIINGEYKHIDFISVNDKRCLNVMGAGFDVDVLENEAQFRKTFRGSICYYLGLLKSLLCIRFRPMKMVIDGKEQIDCACLIFALANGKYYGGGMPVALDASVDDGLLDLLVIKKLPLYKVPYILVKFLKGNVRDVKKHTVSCKCKSFCCYLGDVSMQTDGEIKKNEQVECKVCAGELKAFL